MKLVVLFLSISFIFQILPTKECHAKARSEKMEMMSHDMSEMDCHKQVSERSEKKHRGNNESECGGCLSLCCHFVLYSIPFEEIQDDIKSYISQNNRDMKNLFEQDFTADNFRPLIVS